MATADTGQSLVERTLLRLQRWSLYFYPRTLRRSHAEEMQLHFAALFARETKRQRRGSARRMLRFWIRDLRRSLATAYGPSWLPKSGKPSRRSLPPVIDALGRDLAMGLRGLRRSPSFFAICLLTLTLGIGANVAVFTVISRVVLEPLPYPDSHGILRIDSKRFLSARQVDALREQMTTVSSLAAVGAQELTLVGQGTPRTLSGTVSGPSLFSVLRVEPALGRALNDEDSMPGAEPVALLTWELWKEAFGADSKVIGRTVQIGGGGAPGRTVIGVLPPGFASTPWDLDVLIPMNVQRGSHDYEDMYRYLALGRLASGASVAQTRAELRAVTARLAAPEVALFTRQAADRAEVSTFLESRVGSVRSQLYILLAAVGLVLLIACSNVANLLLVRSAGRRREIATRFALGAGRLQILRQLLAESLVLAGLGGVLGLGFGWVSLKLLGTALANRLPRAEALALDSRTLLFTLAICLLCGVVFGTAPALRSVSLSAGSRGNIGERFGLHRVFVGLQVVLCAILLVAAGLLSKSFWLLTQVDPGFEPGATIALRVAPPAKEYAEEGTRRILFERIEKQLAAIPGVAHAGGINLLPLSRGVMGVGISPDGDPVQDSEEPLSVSYRLTTPGYPAAVGLPLLEGRLLSWSDHHEAATVGLINRSLARQLFGERSAVGEQLHWDNGEPWFTVVGVLGDANQYALSEQPQPEVYVPYGQESWINALYFLVRPEADQEVMAEARTAIWSIDAQLPIASETTLEELRRQSLAGAQLNTVLFLLFAAIAIVLAAVGVYGVLSHVVIRRRKEIALRLALGASRSLAVSPIRRSGLSTVIVALIGGLGAAFLLSRSLRSELFLVAPTDPWVFAATGGFLFAVALLAIGLPTRRATSRDPIEGLRVDD